ncbi:MAG: SiaB family protein kinase [Bacillota bacterium]
MVIAKLMELQNTLKRDGILISFSGRLSQGIIEELGEAIKKHMEAEETPKTEIFNVFAVFVEQTHNIKNYAATRQGSKDYETIANSGIVTIGKVDHSYFVCSGNLVTNEDADSLIPRIERLRDLDKAGLKQLYKEQMKREIPPGSQGAGLGLIDIARKASQPIQYSILKLNDTHSFFTLNVIV